MQHICPECHRGLDKGKNGPSTSSGRTEFRSALAQGLSSAGGVRIPPGGCSGKSARVRSSRRSARSGARSDEHTSELQSLMRISYAVFCLKKKQKYTSATLI